MPSHIQVAKMILNACIGFNLSTTGAASRLEDQFGWQVLGSGQNGLAIVHPYNRDLVIKISTNTADGGMDFAAWVFRQQMQGNQSRHLPEIHAVEIRDTLAVIVMERLDPADESHSKYDLARNPEVRLWAQGMSTCRVLNEWFDNAGRPDDLHSGNWMMRQGCPVLIDPAYHRPRGSRMRWESYWRDGKLHVDVNQAIAPVGVLMHEVPLHARRLRPFVDHARPIGHLDHDKHMLAPNMVHRMEQAQRMAAMQPIKPIDWAHLDFGDVEKRIIAHLGLPDKLLGKKADLLIVDDLAAREPARTAALEKWRRLVSGWRTKLPVKVGKEIHHARTELVKDGSPASIRREKEDRMLQLRAKHDNQPLRKGLLSALFQGRYARRLPSTRPIEPKGDKRQSERIGPVDGRSTGVAKGLHNRHTGPPQDMAA